MNIVDKLLQNYPSDRPTLIDASVNRSISMRELQNIIQNLSYIISNQIAPNQKVLLFIKPSLIFAPIVFAILNIGAIPILIDPGMGIKALLKSIKQVSPDFLIAEKIVHLIKFLKPSFFTSINKSYLPSSFGKINELKLKLNENISFQSFQKDPDDLACILFTSGGTGKPKGVEYTHKIFSTQTTILQNLFNLGPSDIDYPGFPLFALFTLTMGMQSVIPPMNPSKPSKANPKKLYQAISKYKPSFVAGSPAIWERLFQYCIQHSLTLPSIKYLVMFGAPVPLSIHKNAQYLIPNGKTYTPYGATESLPIANCSGDQVLKHMKCLKEFSGIYLGKPLPQIDLKIITHTSQDIIECSTFEVGEIIVSGDVVTKQYYQMINETKKSKINFQNKTWHKIGDVGYLDQDSNLWFCGRISHIVKHQDHILYSIPTELVFNQLKFVNKSALIIANDKPAICIISNQKQIDLTELLKTAQAHPHTQLIKQFFICKRFPVDVRHNIKIDRLELGKNLNRYLQ